MSTVVREHRLEDLVQQLKELVRMQALVESQGASPAQLAAHSFEIAQTRAELAQLAKVSASEAWTFPSRRKSKA